MSTLLLRRTPPLLTLRPATTTATARRIATTRGMSSTGNVSPSSSSYPRPHLIPTSGTYPRGWVAGGVATGVKKTGAKDLTLVASPAHGVTGAAVFTQNAFAAAPVVVSKAVLSQQQQQQQHNANTLSALVVNSGCANACTGAQGLEDAWRMSRKVDAEMPAHAKGTLVMSTGVIGQHLSMEKIEKGIEALVKRAGDAHADWMAAAEGVMTTDTFPKLRSRAFGGYRMAGWSKGAGMIHPNMATMLSAIFTDAHITRECLDAATRYAADRSFNAISIDGDTSTNDTFAVLANGAAETDGSTTPTLISDLTSRDYLAFRTHLTEFAAELAKLIVRDGEGATKFVEIHVTGATTFQDARTIASTIATSPLVKTALYGKDANWGRIICAVGYSGVPIVPAAVNLHIASLANPAHTLHLFKNGAPHDTDEAKAALILDEEDLKLTVQVGRGDEEATMYTCDFSHGYISINADYRS
ncbi:arginine biosynthesis protein ArgJ [Powellomyces hirtus]|nr:arginine biosynthesis protein ArgJ [Powellomyces hirtus]